MRDRTWKIDSWKIDSEPRWKIWNWPGGECGVGGPVIRAADDTLTGLDWVEAATVEVMPVAELERALAALKVAKVALDSPGTGEQIRLKALGEIEEVLR